MGGEFLVTFEVCLILLLLLATHQLVLFFSFFFNILQIIKDFLKPIYTPEDLEADPQPVTLLFEDCQKKGKQVHIENQEKGSTYVAKVYVDRRLVASGSSKQKPIARLNAAREALIILSDSTDTKIKRAVTIDGIDGSFEIEGAKQKLHDFCCRKKWQSPSYR